MLKYSKKNSVLPLMLCDSQGCENFHILLKIVFMGFPELSQNGPTKLLVWIFGGQSTFPSLHSPLFIRTKIASLFLTFIKKIDAEALFIQVIGAAPNMF